MKYNKVHFNSQFFFIALSFCFINTIIGQSNNEKFEAKKGIMDLRNWDFRKEGLIQLNGEWEFYWQQLLEPKDFTKGNPKKSFNITVPDKWNNYSINNKKLPPTGFATYRLIVLTNKIRKRLALGFRLALPATKCFVNGELVGYNGKIGKRENTTTAEYTLHYNDFETFNDTIEIVLQVADYHFNAGGFYIPLELGSSETLLKEKKIDNITHLFQMGCFSIMAVYHLMLFFLRRKNNSTLFFALSTIGFALYFFVYHNVLSYFNIYISFESVLRLFLLTTNLTIGGFFLYVYSLFPDEFKKGVAKFIVTFHLAIFIVAFTPLKLFIKISVFTQIYTYLAILYSFIVVIIASRRKREDAKTFLWGVLFLFLSLLNDGLNYMNIINTAILLGNGLMIFFLFQSYIISARFSRAFKLSESLTIELKDMNENLEDLVVKRTHKIEQQKEKIQTQNERLIELDRFKQGMTSMIVHDLKNPLNTILHASDSEIEEARANKKGIIKSTGRQMLNMVLNILDVNKFEEANVHLNIKENSLNEIFNLATAQVPFLLEQKNIQIINNATNTYIVKCDKEIIQRVFVNLLTNSIKYSPHNSKIELIVGKTSTDELPQDLKKIEFKEEINDRLLIALRDYGTGIKAGAVSEIFQKFKQIEATDSGSTKSTGLGLTF